MSRLDVNQGICGLADLMVRGLYYFEYNENEFNYK